MNTGTKYLWINRWLRLVNYSKTLAASVDTNKLKLMMPIFGLIMFVVFLFSIVGSTIFFAGRPFHVVPADELQAVIQKDACVKTVLTHLNQNDTAIRYREVDAAKKACEDAKIIRQQQDILSAK